MIKLRKGMSVEEFDRGYFYAVELKAFAKELGIQIGCFKKNELELHIRSVLNGEDPANLPKSLSNRRKKGDRDQLNEREIVSNYVDDKITKDFLLQEVRRHFSSSVSKSGQWYWLNAWRKEQIASGNVITYGDLVKYLHKLMIQKGRLPQIPSARMNNFITDFLRDPSNTDKNKKQVLQQWEKLKNLPIPKNYQSYKTYISKNK